MPYGPNHEYRIGDRVTYVGGDGADPALAAYVGQVGTVTAESGSGAWITVKFDSDGTSHGIKHGYLRPL